MQLKGKVKTLIAEDTTVATSFDQSGNIVYIRKEDGTDDEKTFIYLNGVLIKEIHAYNLGIDRDTFITSYSYGTSGRYVPMTNYNVIEAGLYCNLTGFGIYDNTQHYETKGDSVLMIFSNGIRDDTSAIFTFNGGLFPVTMDTRYGLTTFTYAEDGRFLTQTEVLDYRYELVTRITAFKSNSKYLLPVSRTVIIGNGTPDIKQYTYNKYEDLIRVGYEKQYRLYFDYEYDSKGNWISRCYCDVYPLEEPTEPIKETRRITYWD